MAQLFGCACVIYVLTYAYHIRHIWFIPQGVRYRYLKKKVEGFFFTWFTIARRISCPLMMTQPIMMTSSNGNIFRVTGLLCGEFTGHRRNPTQRPVSRSFDVFFDLHLNKRLSEQSLGWWFETPWRPLCRRCTVLFYHVFTRFYENLTIRKRIAEYMLACISYFVFRFFSW